MQNTDLLLQFQSVHKPFCFNEKPMLVWRAGSKSFHREIEMVLDEIDYKILRILQQNADLPITEIGEQVGLSHTPCWRRIKKMQDSGILGKRHYQINGKEIDFDISIFVFIKLNQHSAGVLDEFEEHVRPIPEVVQCFTVSGEFDYLLRIVVKSVHDYEKTVKEQILKLPNVGTVNSHFSLKEIKNTTELPI